MVLFGRSVHYLLAGAGINHCSEVYPVRREVPQSLERRDGACHSVVVGGGDASRCRLARSTADKQAGCRAMIAAAVAALQLSADDARTPECQKWLVYSWAACTVTLISHVSSIWCA